MMDRAYQFEMNKNPRELIPAEKMINSGEVDYNTCANYSSSTQFFSFGDSKIWSPEVDKFDYGTVYYCGGAMDKNSGHVPEHVLAERKRREKLTLNFVALSALIPGLNKTDKASVLGGAIKYVKELEERLKWAEKEAEDQKRVIESAMFTNKNNRGEFSVRPVPKIETRVLDKEVLVRIHCKKHKGCFSNILSQIEKLKLTIVNTCVLPFGHFRLDITIVAKMEVGFCMTAKDLGKKLRETLVQFI